MFVVTYVGFNREGSSLETCLGVFTDYHIALKIKDTFPSKEKNYCWIEKDGNTQYEEGNSVEVVHKCTPEHGDWSVEVHGIYKGEKLAKDYYTEMFVVNKHYTS
jgi:hypothetical protein